MSEEYVTKSGKVLNDEEIQALADEAEQGYDVEHLKRDERPFREAGYPAGPVSMGGGRKLAPSGSCSKSPDGKHHYTAVSNIQSVEHFVCDYCNDDWWD